MTLLIFINTAVINIEILFWVSALMNLEMYNTMCTTTAASGATEVYSLSHGYFT